MNRPADPSPEPLATQTHDDELVIDLADLARHLWTKKRPIIAAALLGALVMAGISLTMPNVYESTILLAPAQDEKGGLSALAGQFGGLASLAGIELSGNDQLVKEGIALLTARDFLLSYIHEKNLKPLLFYRKWDEESLRWRKPNIIAKTTKRLRSILSDKEESNRYVDPNEPTDWDTYKLFLEDFIEVKQDKKTLLVTVSVRSYSPDDAQQWAQDLVRRVNESLRAAKKIEAEKSIAYLQKASEKTSLIDAQKAMFQLIEVQTKTIMFANAKEEFAFKTIDPAFYPEEKIKPKRTLMVIGGAVFGSTLIFIYLLIRFVRNLRRA